MWAIFLVGCIFNMTRYDISEAFKCVIWCVYDISSRFFSLFWTFWLFMSFDYNTMEAISQMIGRATNDFSLCPIPVFQTSGRLTVPRTLHKREISPTECWGCASIISPPCTLLQLEWDMQETFFVAYSGWALAPEKNATNAYFILFIYLARDVLK